MKVQVTTDNPRKNHGAICILLGAIIHTNDVIYWYKSNEFFADGTAYCTLYTVH